jgi:prepilin signal peptidase PulO-like enzyme (type II secretory pathway)
MKFVPPVFAFPISRLTFAIVLLLSGRRGRKDAIPFAPMLCVAALAGIYLGEGPVRLWLGI